MKLYVLDKHKISFMNNGSVHSYKPFILVSDEDCSMFEKSGYTLIDTIFDVDELRLIAEKIENISKDIDNKLSKSMSEYERLNTEIKSFCDYADNLKTNLSSLDNVKEYADNFWHNMENKSSLIEEKFKELEKQLYDINENFNEFIEIKKAEINNFLMLIENAEKDVSERINTQYYLMKKEMNDIYNSFHNEADELLKEMRELSDLSRKWAVNPVNVPVEQGKYSARHYALKMSGENK